MMILYSSDNDSVQDADQSQNNDESGDDNGSDIDGMADDKFDGNPVPPLNSTDEHEVQQSKDPFELEVYPRLFALERDKEIHVAVKLASLIDSFRRPVRGGVELQQLTDLVSLMDSVILCSSHDRWRCDLSGDGDFSVKKNIMNGLPKLKYVEDQLCSSCELGKAKRSTFKTKIVPSSKGGLNLLHMDLCGPMWIESINGKKYILVIIDDYSCYTLTHFLRSKDETPEVLKDFLKLIQHDLQA
nr:Gag-Pol polyprotein [Tanacetum cinerariifolium]